MRVLILATLLVGALSQTIEECSSGGPEFWCASCQNAAGCSTLIPGLVEYCQQIGIFTPGQCSGGGDGGGGAVTLPVTNPPTAGPTELPTGDDGALPISE